MKNDIGLIFGKHETGAKLTRDDVLALLVEARRLLKEISQWSWVSTEESRRQLVQKV